MSTSRPDKIGIPTIRQIEDYFHSIIAMKTRRAAKKQRIETGPLLGPVHLPAEVIGNNLLRCLDLPSLLRLSTCNSAVKREVFRKQIGQDENASIWQVIDFGTVSKQMASKLTDDQLKKLLVKCHAKEVTTVLKLTGCVGLKGKGLEPLRGSIVLREIDLKLSKMEGLETTYVLNLLSSMPPIAPVPVSFGNRHLGLSIVKFPIANRDAGNYYDRFREETRGWLVRFTFARQVCLSRHKTCCDHCKEAMCDRWKGVEEDLFMVARTDYCEACKKASCHGFANSESECPIVEKCQFCMRQCCSDNKGCTKGNDINTCDECFLEACEDCIDWDYCSTCDKYRCGRGGDCDKGGIFCIYCIDPVCEDCCIDGRVVTGKDGVWRALCRECKDQGKQFDEKAIKYL